MSALDPRTLTIAVTGLNATDNPGPGVGVLRALSDEASLPRDVVSYGGTGRG